MKALQIQFKPSTYNDPVEALINLKQTVMVESYKIQFELLSNQVRGLSNTHKLSCFLEGLKDEIKIVLRMLNPSNVRLHMGFLECKKKTLVW